MKVTSDDDRETIGVRVICGRVSCISNLRAHRFTIIPRSNITILFYRKFWNFVSTMLLWLWYWLNVFFFCRETVSTEGTAFCGILDVPRLHDQDRGQRSREWEVHLCSDPQIFHGARHCVRVPEGQRSREVLRSAVSFCSVGNLWQFLGTMLLKW